MEQTVATKMMKVHEVTYRTIYSRRGKETVDAYLRKLLGLPPSGIRRGPKKKKKPQ